MIAALMEPLIVSCPHCRSVDVVPGARYCHSCGNVVAVQAARWPKELVRAKVLEARCRLGACLKAVTFFGVLPSFAVSVFTVDRLAAWLAIGWIAFLFVSMGGGAALYRWWATLREETEFDEEETRQAVAMGLLKPPPDLPKSDRT